MHTEETKFRISQTLKGKKPAGFFILKVCPFCGQEMNAPNLGRHYKPCKRRAELDNDYSPKQFENLKTRLRAYKLTPETYFEMLQRQGGICAICGGDNGGRDLVVDHCHSTNQVRKLLCMQCNMFLGGARERIEVLRQGIHYLEAHGVVEPESCETPEFDPYKD